MSGEENTANHLDKINTKVATAEITATREQRKLRKEIIQSCIDKVLSPHFFVFLITILVVISGIIFMNKNQDVDRIIEYWKVILPIITTYIGYAIGHNTNKSD